MTRFVLQLLGVAVAFAAGLVCNCGHLRDAHECGPDDWFPCTECDGCGWFTPVRDTEIEL